MINISVLFLVTALLIADALIFFVVGYVFASKSAVDELKKNGWTIEPPEVGGAGHA